VAYRAVDEPAEIPHLEFPGWTGLPGWGRAVANVPAGTNAFPSSSFESPQEKHLALDVHWNLPPPLFKALNRFQGRSQELRHLLLGLLKFLTQRMKFFVVHGFHSFKGNGSQDVLKYPLTVYTTMYYLCNSFFGMSAYSAPGKGPVQE
jgi:hypothetical protein